MSERTDFRTKRLYVDDALSAGQAIEADRAKANYLLNVLRLKSGDAVLLFNGRDGEWLADIVPSGRKACTLVPQKQLRPQPEPYDLQLYFAPLKQARLDYMVQKAVEMGAGYLQPVITRYTQVQKLNAERMQANMLEAAEQCGILTVPEMGAPIALERMFETWPLEQSNRVLIFCDELAEAPASAQGLRPLTGGRWRC